MQSQESWAESSSEAPAQGDSTVWGFPALPSAPRVSDCRERSPAIVLQTIRSA